MTAETVPDAYLFLFAARAGCLLETGPMARTAYISAYVAGQSVHLPNTVVVNGDAGSTYDYGTAPQNASNAPAPSPHASLSTVLPWLVARELAHSPGSVSSRPRKRSGTRQPTHGGKGHHLEPGWTALRGPVKSLRQGLLSVVSTGPPSLTNDSRWRVRHVGEESKFGRPKEHLRGFSYKPR